MLRSRWTRAALLAAAGVGITAAVLLAAGQVTFAGVLEGNRETDLEIAATLEDRFSDGRDAGYEEGRQAGYAEGLKEGKVIGREDAYDRGVAQGYQLGFQAGFEDGERAGHDRGYADGQRAGWSGGYDQGLAEGTGQGRNAGFKTGCLFLFDALQTTRVGDWWDYFYSNAVAEYFEVAVCDTLPQS